MTETIMDAQPDRSAADLAHAMRNPLTVILNAAHLLTLSRDDASAERVRQIIVRQVGRLVGLVDELSEMPLADRGIRGGRQ